MAMLNVLGMVKTAVGNFYEAMNTVTHFVIVPQARAERILKDFGIRKEDLECTFCKTNLSDLKHLKAIYRHNGEYLVSCDRFECFMETRDKLIE